MKSITQTKYSPQNLYLSKQEQSRFATTKQKPQHHQVEQQTRRYSQIPKAMVLNGKKQSIESRITYNKSQYPMNCNRSGTPNVRVYSSSGVNYESHYRQLQQVLKKQNQNFYHQNQFLKQQIAKLYEREAKHKQIIKRYKQQLRIIRLQNQVYQQRYQEIKSYINSVIQKITEMTVESQVIDDKDMLRSSSLELVNRLREELNLYEQLKDQNEYKLTAQQTHSQQSIQQHEGYYDHQNPPNNIINDFLQLSEQKLPQLTDLQQTRYIKQHKYQNKPNGYPLNKPPKPMPPNINKNNYTSDHRLSFSPVSYDESNPSNNLKQQGKNIDLFVKTDNFLQDTSQSNHLNAVNQQIEELTDQSEALMYELKKKGNQDQEIKKKIIRISQKIRQLKMETQTQQFQRFTSLQQISPNR